MNLQTPRPVPFVLIATLVLGLSSPPAALAQEASPDFAARLVEAELLELSAGEIKGAMTIYEEISGAESAPAALRARALLYRARCLRKLGDLEKARRLLEDILKTHATERDVVRQARSFLREIRSGKADNPQFDWLAELERNPEIQARVFDLAMDLVDPGSTTGERARKQLLALGTICAPVLEKLIETSRDATHRQHLAFVLVQVGRYEHLPRVLDPQQPPRGGRPTRDQNGRFSSTEMIPLALKELLDSLPRLSDDDLKRLGEAVNTVADDPAVRPIRSLLGLWAAVGGDASDAADDAAALLSQVELLYTQYDWDFDADRSLARLVERRPELADVLLARLDDPDLPQNARAVYYRLASESFSDRLTVDHHVRYRVGRLRESQVHAQYFQPHLFDDYGVGSRPYREVEILEDLGAFEALRDLADEKGDLLVFYFWMRYAAEDRLAEAPKEWAPILRRVRRLEQARGFPPIGAWKDRTPSERAVRRATADSRGLGFSSGLAALHVWAEADDDAIPEFVTTLQNRREEFPEYRGYGEYEGYHMQRRQIDNRIPPLSPSYIAAMTGLLESDDDVVQKIALEALSHAPAMSAGEVQKAAETVLEQSPDTELRAAAMQLLAGCFSHDALDGARLAGFVERELHRCLEQRGEVPAELEARLAACQEGDWGATSSSPLRPPSSTRRSAVRRTRSRICDGVYEPLRDVDDDARHRLHTAMVARVEESRGLVVLDWWTRRVDGGPFTERLGAEFDGDSPSLENPALRAWFGTYLTGASADFLERHPDTAEFLVTFAADRSHPEEARQRAFMMCLRQSLMPIVFEHFDWRGCFGGDHPLADFVAARTDSLVAKTATPEIRQVFFEAALASPQESVRKSAVKALPSDIALGDAGDRDVLKVLEELCGDPSAGVRRAVVARLGDVSSADAGKVYLRLLADADPPVRQFAVQGVGRFGLEESIEPLTKRLDDPDVSVREAALKALKQVRDRLTEREEWKMLIEELRRRKNSNNNSESPPAQDP